VGSEGFKPPKGKKPSYYAISIITPFGHSGNSPK
tara:strand:+ start:1533 stop:1634 length:102 start_codon:yes stop_codon:yes gene_type:complete